MAELTPINSPSDPSPPVDLSETGIKIKKLEEKVAPEGTPGDK
jgi:hypothetical protein